MFFQRSVAVLPAAALLLLICAQVVYAAESVETEPVAGPGSGGDVDNANDSAKGSKGASSSPGVPDEATLRKMKVRELKALLSRKGPDAECLACSSKVEYVQRVLETKDWPDVVAPEENEPTVEELKNLFANSNSALTKEKLDALKESLEKEGVDTSKMFVGNNFDAEAFVKQFKKVNAQQEEKDLPKGTRNVNAEHSGPADPDTAGKEGAETKSEL